jgi:hypothetical protein
MEALEIKTALEAIKTQVETKQVSKQWLGGIIGICKKRANFNYRRIKKRF